MSRDFFQFMNLLKTCFYKQGSNFSASCRDSFSEIRKPSLIVTVKELDDIKNVHLMRFYFKNIAWSHMSIFIQT